MPVQMKEWPDSRAGSAERRGVFAIRWGVAEVPELGHSPEEAAERVRIRSGIEVYKTCILLLLPAAAFAACWLLAAGCCCLLVACCLLLAAAAGCCCCCLLPPAAGCCC